MFYRHPMPRHGISLLARKAIQPGDAALRLRSA